MIFIGDIARINSKVDFEGLELFGNKFTIANLEGDINIDLSNIENNVVFNNKDAIEEITKKFNVKLYNLANNHIMDTFSTPAETIDFLSKIKVHHIGAGMDREEAARPIELNINNEETTIFSFGWDVIGCRKPSDVKAGVNIYDPLKNIEDLTKYRTLNPQRKIIVLMHWNYELEAYPQPMDRQFAHKLIDIGVEAVVGCHSHCVQGVEIYKEKPIVYSLGNWLFSEGIYFNSKLKFPDISRLQLAFEIKESEMICHWFEKKDESTIKYLKSENLFLSSKVKELTKFQGFDEKEYLDFFKKNRRKKNALPIYINFNHSIRNKLKTIYVEKRQSGIKILLSLGLKKGPS